MKPGDLRVLRDSLDSIYLYAINDFQRDVFKSSSPLIVIKKIDSKTKKLDDSDLNWWMVLSSQGLFVTVEFMLRDWTKEL